MHARLFHFTGDTEVFCIKDGNKKVNKKLENIRNMPTIFIRGNPHVRKDLFERYLKNVL